MALLGAAGRDGYTGFRHRGVTRVFLMQTSRVRSATLHATYMPYSLTLSADGTRLMGVGAGVVTAQELLDATRGALDLVQRPELVTHATLDLMNVESLTISRHDVAQIAEADLALAASIPVMAMAIVAPTDLIYGQCRMYAQNVLAPRWTIRVCRSSDEAADWLATQVTRRS